MSHTIIKCYQPNYDVINVIPICQRCQKCDRKVIYNLHTNIKMTLKPESMSNCICNKRNMNYDYTELAFWAHHIDRNSTACQHTALTGCRKMGTLVHCWREYQTTSTAPIEKHLAIPKNNIKHFSISPTISHVSIYPKHTCPII
jgi:hypothetical protein